MNADTRLIDMTLGDLLAILEEREAKMRADIIESKRETLPRVVYGISGIAQLFNCSKSTAMRIKNSGKIAGAITQYKHTICVNVDKALSLYNQQN